MNEDYQYVECNVELEDLAGKKIRIEGEMPLFACELLKQAKYFTMTSFGSMLNIAVTKTREDTIMIINWTRTLGIVAEQIARGLRHGMD